MHPRVARDEGVVGGEGGERIGARDMHRAGVAGGDVAVLIERGDGEGVGEALHGGGGIAGHGERRRRAGQVGEGEAGRGAECRLTFAVTVYAPATVSAVKGGAVATRRRRSSPRRWWRRCRSGRAPGRRKRRTSRAGDCPDSPPPSPRDWWRKAVPSVADCGAARAGDDRGRAGRIGEGEGRGVAVAVRIQYYAWNCVNNCVLPCFEWRRILNEKYDVTRCRRFTA